jgi:transmembrane sensor
MASSARSLRLEDGTTIMLATDESSIRTLESAPGTVGVELVRGTAHFDVTHIPGRVFRVIASDVIVEVVGTSFVVERYASNARVTVEEGRVKVRWGDDVRTLSAGEAGTFGAQMAGASGSNDDPAEKEAHDGGAPPLSTDRGQRTSPGEWRSLAREGDFGRAYEALRVEGPSAVRDEPNELLLQADVARLSGHPEQSIAPLKRVLSSHAADAHAPLAAFTLGRVLLDELKRPRDAAQAFARVYRLEPSGPLAQDALAREVEAWSRAGETALARDRGLRYLESYPQGRKLNAVRRNAGLE